MKYKLGTALILGSSLMASHVTLAAPTDDQMFIRGSFNSWAAKPMTLKYGDIFETTVNFDSAGSFKFDVFGNWSKNYGDNEADGQAEIGGSNIQVSEAGTYLVQFSDVNGAYTISKAYQPHLKTFNEVNVRGSFNGWGTTPMTLEDEYVWKTTVTVEEGASFKFDMMGDWSLDFGEGNGEYGNAEVNGGNIQFSQGAGTYEITFIDAQQLYGVAKQSEQAGLGDVQFTVKDTEIANGQLVYVPYSGAGIYLDNASVYGGAPASAFTDENGIAIATDLESGTHQVQVGKMTSSHSVYGSEYVDFSVVANSTASVELIINDAESVVNAYANVESGKALYITGQTELLGNWATAYKMTYSEGCSCFTYTGALPRNLQYKIVKANWVSGDSISTNGVQWQQGANNSIQATAPVMANTVNPQF